MSCTRPAVLVPVTALALVAVAGCSGGAPAPEAGPTGPSEVPAASTLRAWDERRAAAYATGAVGELRRLYVAGSAAGAADVRLLQRYVERGLVIGGMRMQVLALDVLQAAPHVVRVRVTDRLVGAEAQGSTGVVPLPRDTPSTRVVTLRLVRGEWRVESVRPEAGRQP